ncbi:MAG: Ig-like domain-containing protein [Lachnospiraceae bacterium]|nr:Ig-like domain-containing protein [Lachnospiraceae bacterium]
MNKKIFCLLASALLLLIILNPQKIYASDNEITIYEYDYSNSTHSDVPYNNMGTTQGLKPFHLFAEYPAEPTANFEWEVTSATKSIAVVTGRSTTKAPNKSLGTVIGLKGGTATIKVTAFVNDIEVSEAYCKVTITGSFLNTNILGTLYRTETEFTNLPDNTDVNKDFQKNSPAHPRIMADSDDFSMIQKYIVYANGLEYGFDTEYKRLVKKEIDTLYDGENISDEYYQYMRKLNQTVTSLADKKVEADENYIYTIVDGTMQTLIKKMDEEVEVCAFSYRLSKAYVDNVESYKTKFSSKESYEKEYANALSVLEEDYAKAERIVSILTNYSEFPDWSPGNFLDVGMVAYDFALGYDWIYDYMTEEQRLYFGNVLLDRGVVDCRAYMRSITGQQRFRSNWSAAIYSGCGTAAAAVYELDPYECSSAVSDCARFLPILINQMAPDGAFSEGITYWGLSWRYIGYLLSTFSRTFGDDYGLTEVLGANEAMYFPIYMKGNPSTVDYCYQFNYGDAMEYANSANSALLWLCNSYSEKKDFFSETQLFTWYILEYTNTYQYGEADIQDLLWLPPLLSKYGSRLKSPNTITGEDLKQLGINNYKTFFSDEKITNDILVQNSLMSDTVTYGRGDKTSLITYSQDITDKYSVGFATKDSNTKVSHRDMDAGNFIFDALGARWVCDWGRTTYTGNRNDYYIKRAEGHNTLVINPDAGDDQNNNTTAKITGTSVIQKDDCMINDQGGYIVYDMSNSYNLSTFEDGTSARNANSVQRGFKLFDNGQRLLIQDELVLEEASDVWWFLQTPIKAEDFVISGNGRSAILTQTNIDGKKVHLKAELKVTSDNPFVYAVFTPMEYKTMSPELMENSVNQSFYAVNSDKRKLSIHVSQDAGRNTALVKEATIAVVLTPIYDEEDYNKDMPEIVPLRKWMPERNYPVTELSIRNKETNKTVSTLYPDSKEPINLSAVIQPYYASNKTLTWKSSNTKLATVDENGVVTPLKTGSVKITASTTDGSNLSATVKLVNNINIPLSSAAFDKTNMELDVEGKGELTLSYAPLDTTDSVSAVWSSSDTNVAYIDENSNGFTRTIVAKSAGTAVITATIGNFTAQCNVVVNQPSLPITSVTFDRTELNLKAESTGTLTLSYAPLNTTDSTSVVWSNSNSKVATLKKNGNGLSRTVVAKSAGTTTITATMGSFTATCRVVVKPKDVSFTAERRNAQTKLKFLIEPKDSTKVKYAIYSSTTKNGKYTLVKTTSGQSPSIPVQKGKKMYYKVRAYIQVNSVKYYGPYSEIMRL